MKNKKTLYIFLSVNVLVWGLVLYKIFSSFSNEVSSSGVTAAIVPVSFAETSADTFSLIANYADPFLGKMIVKTDPSPNPGPAPVKKTAPVKTPVVWPTIVYGGLIKNQKSSKQLVLVQINGQENFMNEGSTVNEVQLVKVFKDSIRVLYKKEKKTILK